METSKFGRIFIEKKTSTGESELILLPSVRFSNHDHKWYDSNGEIHPEFEKRFGQKFSIQFKIDQHDKNGVLVPFEGNIKMFYSVGELAPQDFEGIPAAEKEDLELVQRYNLVPKDVTVEIVRRRYEAAGFLVASFPGVKLRDCPIQRLYHLTFYTFDDYLEKLPEEIDYNYFKTFLRFVTDIMDGKKVDLGPNNPDVKNVAETLLNYAKYIQHFHNELSKAEGDTGRGQWVRETYKEYVQGICLENSAEWKVQRKGVFDRVQKDLRLVGSGAYLFQELTLFDANIQVKPEIRNTSLFKWYCMLYAQHTCWVNDVMSYYKEVAGGYAGAGCNKVHLLHYTNGLSLKDAMQKVVDKSNELCKRCVEDGKLLQKLYKEDEDVQRFVSKTKDIVYGHVQWVTFSHRFHKDLIFDCVLDDEST